MTDFTEKESDTVHAALKNLIFRYESLREEVRAGSVQEAMAEQVGTAKSALRKLREGGENGCLFIYVPDGIHDQGLEDKLRSKVPQHPEHPDEKNVFWSTSYDNFVVRGHVEEAEEAIREYYGDEKTLVKNPSWASKPNTWQIVDKNSVESA